MELGGRGAGGHFFSQILADPTTTKAGVYCAHEIITCPPPPPPSARRGYRSHVHDDDPIRVPDGGQPVCDNGGRMLFGEQIVRQLWGDISLYITTIIISIPDDI